jgi:alkylhydroperoxidase/carboxymuconolactone decarboxylase family protein YurZ
MKEEVFFGEGMPNYQKEYPDIYKAIVGLNATYTGKVIDYRTQKLIALGINAAASDDRATKKQMISAMKEFNITKDEIVDVLRSACIELELIVIQCPCIKKVRRSASDRFQFAL